MWATIAEVAIANGFAYGTRSAVRRSTTASGICMEGTFALGSGQGSDEPGGHQEIHHGAVQVGCALLGILLSLVRGGVADVTLSKQGQFANLRKSASSPSRRRIMPDCSAARAHSPFRSAFESASHASAMRCSVALRRGATGRARDTPRTSPASGPRAACQASQATCRLP